MSLFLGFDTSNYTTAVAVCGGETVNLRKIIDVGSGQRGIRQSDGVFAHIKELPKLFDRLSIDFGKVAAVGVSVRPRNQENSYMPVFTVGEGFAAAVAKALNVPLFKTSHQDGHIMAGLVSCGEYGLINGEFTAVHLSGGTTEILECKYKNGSFNPKIVGGTKDISAGQLLDRLGVKLKMQFPCGKELDRLSLTEEKVINLKMSVKNGFMNFSGIETKLLSMAETEKPSLIARSALVFVGNSVLEALSYTKPENVLFVGGVASNTIIREMLKKGSFNAYFAESALSCDNAVGVAHIAKKMYEEMK